MMRLKLFPPRLVTYLGVVLALLMVPAAAGPHILVDMTTGRVLDQDGAFEPWYPASLTKVMTAYVTFRAVAAGEIRLDSPVRVSERAAKEPPSKMGYKPGSVLTYDNAIKILMVKSANDVATAVAESIAGSRQAFAARMNAEAQRLGMTDTRFVNAHGLHDDNQVTTARDLAILGVAILNEFPEHAHYFSIDAISAGQTVMDNNNTLIGRFDGADGMKTGYTCPSGFNLMATASRSGRSLLAVVIGSHTVESRADQAANLLGRGFEKPSAAAPYLGQLRPTGREAAAAPNLRPVICTDEHWKKVAASRPDGRPVFSSPYLSEPVRPPSVIAVTLGGATGPESSAPRYADVPIPTPRPDYTPESVAQGG